MSTVIPARRLVTAIMSAERTYRTADENDIAHGELRQLLAGRLALGELLSVQECAGCYRGTPEQSFAFTGAPGQVKAIARDLARRYDQESVLFIDSGGCGTLWFHDDDVNDSIGTYDIVRGLADCEAWTRVLATGEQFTFV